ncbi:unnamed protein product [Ectocarpus fasciculatus]
MTFIRLLLPQTRQFHCARTSRSDTWPAARCVMRPGIWRGPAAISRRPFFWTRQTRNVTCCWRARFMRAAIWRVRRVSPGWPPHSNHMTTARIISRLVPGLQSAIWQGGSGPQRRGFPGCPNTICTTRQSNAHRTSRARCWRGPVAVPKPSMTWRPTSSMAVGSPITTWQRLAGPEKSARACTVWSRP